MNGPPTYSIVREDEKDAQKQHLFFIWCRKECPLSFSERLVWSALVKADRMTGDGASQAKIAEWTGLDRKTIREALKAESLLLSSGLVIKEHYRSWRAVKPTKVTTTWFGVKKKQKTREHWADDLAYWPVELPEAKPRLTFDDVLWGLLCLLKGSNDAVVHESLSGN